MQESSLDLQKASGMCVHGNFPDSCGICKTEGLDHVEDKYGPEAIARDVAFKAEKIRGWAAEMGLEEGKDFLVIEKFTEVMDDEYKVAPHEEKSFAVGVHEDHYAAFREYILGRYKDERKKENPDGDVRLDYSWGGRFLVGWDSVPFDTVPMATVNPPSARTRHGEFRRFFQEQAGIEFPTAETLNPILRNISKGGIGIYERALEKMKAMRDADILPDDGYGLIDSLTHFLLILNDAKEGDAVADLPEMIQGSMSDKMTHFADLTYNAEDIADFDRIMEISGVDFPDEIRLDRIFERWGFDRRQMEEMCRKFADTL